MALVDGGAGRLNPGRPVHVLGVPNVDVTGATAKFSIPCPVRCVKRHID